MNGDKNVSKLISRQKGHGIEGETEVNNGTLHKCKKQYNAEVTFIKSKSKKCPFGCGFKA